MNKKTVIGITSSQNEGVIRMRANYAQAVLDAGGIPVFLPCDNAPSRIAQYTEILDGLLFAGGVDIDPVRYGEVCAFDCVEINRERDAFELALFGSFIGTKKPILGICRGIQLINVALGGTLYQHIDGHRQTENNFEHTQRVSLTENSMIARISGTNTLYVNSFHHQAVKNAAPGINITALSEDGFAECIEMPAHPFLMAVQWHPEMYYANDVASAGLFRAFVRAASVKM